jgi:hypothetical protein
MGKKAVGNFIDGHGICTKITDLFLIVAHCGRGSQPPTLRSAHETDNR